MTEEQPLLSTRCAAGAQKRVSFANPLVRNNDLDPWFPSNVFLHKKRMVPMVLALGFVWALVLGLSLLTSGAQKSPEGRTRSHATLSLSYADATGQGERFREGGRVSQTMRDNVKEMMEYLNDLEEQQKALEKWLDRWVDDDLPRFNETGEDGKDCGYFQSMKIKLQHLMDSISEMEMTDNNTDFGALWEEWTEDWPWKGEEEIDSQDADDDFEQVEVNLKKKIDHIRNELENISNSTEMITALNEWLDGWDDEWPWLPATDSVSQEDDWPWSDIESVESNEDHLSIDVDTDSIDQGGEDEENDVSPSKDKGGGESDQGSEDSASGDTEMENQDEATSEMGFDEQTTGPSQAEATINGSEEEPNKTEFESNDNVPKAGAVEEKEDDKTVDVQQKWSFEDVDDKAFSAGEGRARDDDAASFADSGEARHRGGGGGLRGN